MKHPLIAALIGAGLALASGTAAASTFVRSGIEDLTRRNPVVAVVDVVSNERGDFILTDVRLQTVEALKGPATEHADLSVVLAGGTVGDTTTLIVSGARLEVGHRYVLFLDRSDLPGASQVLTPVDHAQGVFEIVADGTDVRAISQADAGSLVPDARGRLDIPGGTQGLPLDALREQIRASLD